MNDDRLALALILLGIMFLVNTVGVLISMAAVNYLLRVSGSELAIPFTFGSWFSIFLLKFIFSVRVSAPKKD